VRDLDSPVAVESALRARGYLPDAGLATAVFLAGRLPAPLLLEGAPGVGKTELAKRLAEVLGVTLVRLQCYEGIEVSQAIYDWNYARQLLAARLHAENGRLDEVVELYSEDFLVERPLLRAVRLGDQALLLVDEIDRADEELEAFLLELLAESTVTIPELGTIGSGARPYVVITSNRTRELSDALRRRCIYHWVDLPDPDREAEIIMKQAPGVAPSLAHAIAWAILKIRELRLVKPPGVAEAIDWARALGELGVEEISPDAILATIGTIAKTVEDLTVVRSAIDAIMVPRIDASG
jgi:MoxR-like ATPase